MVMCPGLVSLACALSQDAENVKRPAKIFTSRHKNLQIHTIP